MEGCQVKCFARSFRIDNRINTSVDLISSNTMLVNSVILAIIWARGRVAQWQSGCLINTRSQVQSLARPPAYAEASADKPVLAGRWV